MSLNIALPLQPLVYVRHQLRKIPGAGRLWRLLQKSALATRYYVVRALGYVFYPLLGCRAPLRGYYARTEDFLQHGDGRRDRFEPPSPIDDLASSDPFQPEIFVAVIPRARTLYDSGVVVSPDHRLLGDVSWEGESLVSSPQYHPIMSKLFLPPVKHLPGRVAVISSVKSDNYYHWMFDILPRFGIIQRSGLIPDYYVINATTQFQKDSLKALNIPPHRLLSPTADTHIEADELIIPSLIGPLIAMSPQLQACQYLRSTFLQTGKKAKPHRAIYITRADAGSRRVINEAEIRKEVIDNGFEVISLSDVPFLEQIQLFAEARIIIGPHGAGFTNAVFCQPGSVLIEFLPERWKVDCFERMARLIGITYRSIVCKESDVANGQVSTHDHTVDRAEFRRLLHQSFTST